MQDDTNRRLAAILAADVVGYSRMMAADEVGTLAALKRHRDSVFDPAVAAHRGRVFKLIGDGTLVEFASVVDAVRCALAIQRTPGGDADGVVLRIGINLGDVIPDGDDLYGDGVNVAARLEPLAAPGGICVSAIVAESVGNRVDVPFADGGEVKVKNIDRPIRVWHWRPEGAATPTTPAATGPTTATGSPPSPDEPSIAVLPFRNMSGDAEQDYFADGITEDIITDISRLPGVLVISRNSTFAFKGRTVPAQTVCEDLGVRYVMDGSVRKAGNRVRIATQLIDGLTGRQVWAERFDRDLSDIFAVQDEVTERIVGELEVKLVRPQQTGRTETDVPEAYDLVLRGREQFRRYTADGHSAARRLFTQAVELDPDYAAPHAGLALCHLHAWFQGDTQALDAAMAEAERARARDPNLPVALEAFANVCLFLHRHDDALAAIRRWIAVEPGSADAHANLAGALVFSGEPDEVGPLIERAMRMNPLYPFYYLFYQGQALFMAGRYEEAAAVLRRSAARNPDVPHAYIQLAATYGHLGRPEEAAAALVEVRRTAPNAPASWIITTSPYRREQDLNQLMEGLKKAGLEETEAAT